MSETNTLNQGITRPTTYGEQSNDYNYKQNTRNMAVGGPPKTAQNKSRGGGSNLGTRGFGNLKIQTNNNLNGDQHNSYGAPKTANNAERLRKESFKQKSSPFDNFNDSSKPEIELPDPLKDEKALKNQAQRLIMRLSLDKN